MNEAKSSLNFFGMTRKSWRCQFTLRDENEEALLERFGKFVLLLEGKGISPEVRTAVVTTAPTTEPAKPASSPPATNGHNTQEEFEYVQGGTIAVIANEQGKPRYKFKGGRFKQFGVRCWPETLEKLGWNLDSFKIGQEYSVANYKAKILLKEGKASKVVDLTKVT